MFGFDFDVSVAVLTPLVFVGVAGDIERERGRHGTPVARAEEAGPSPSNRTYGDCHADHRDEQQPAQTSHGISIQFIEPNLRLFSASKSWRCNLFRRQELPNIMNWDGTSQDFRYTLRSLRRDPGFFAAAVLIVARWGSSANTTIFSVVNALLFRPLPFRGSERLVLISNTGGDGGLSSVTSRVVTYQDWRAATKSMEERAAWFAFFDYSSYNLVGIGRAGAADRGGCFAAFPGVSGGDAGTRARLYE